MNKALLTSTLMPSACSPKFYAVKHFSNLVPPGSRVLAYKGKTETNGMPVIVFQRPDGKRIVVTANLTDELQTIAVQLGHKYLNINAEPHSFHSLLQK
jgi:glucosylceramidase